MNERLAPPSGVARKTRSRNGGSRAPSAMSHSRSSAFGDNTSDIYVTSAAYKAPSEIRYLIDFIYYQPQKQYCHRDRLEISGIQKILIKESNGIEQGIAIYSSLAMQFKLKSH